MANQRYDVLAARKYTTKDGAEKTAWTNVGVAFANRDGKGFSVNLHCVPVPDKESGEIRLVMRIPQPREGGGGGSQQGSGSPYGGDDSDIPF